MLPDARLERATTWALSLYAIALPLEGIGTWSPRYALGMQASDLVLTLASPLLALVAWRARSALAREPIVLGCLALAAAGAGTAVLRGSSGLVEPAKHAVFLLTVSSLAAVGTTRSLDRLLGAVVLAGGVAVAVSLAGYGGVVAFANPLRENVPFVFESTHFLFEGVPRLAGTFGISVQEMGEFAVVLIVMALAALRRHSAAARRPARAVLVLAVAALALTFTSSWIAGLTLLAGRASAKWPDRRAIALSLLALAAALAFWTMNFGLPLGRSAGPGTIACAEGETEHFVTWALDAREDRCRQIPMRWPSRGLLTTYWYAKKTAASAFVATPWLGRGRTGYRTFAADAFRRRSGGHTVGTYYDTPHCTPLDALVSSGLPGGAAFAFFLWQVWRARPAVAAATPLWLGLVGLLLVGLNVDLMERRPFWALLGLLAAVRIRSGGREDLTEVLDGPPDAVVERDLRLPPQ